LTAVIGDLDVNRKSMTFLPSLTQLERVFTCKVRICEEVNIILACRSKSIESLVLLTSKIKQSAKLLMVLSCETISGSMCIDKSKMPEYTWKRAQIEFILSELSLPGDSKGLES